MRSVRLLYVASGTLILLCAIMLIRGLLIEDTQASGLLIAGAALVAATAGWLFNNAVSSRIKVREHSLNYLKHATEGLVMPERAAELTAYWREYKIDQLKGEQGDLDAFCRDNYPGHPLFQTLRTMANHYEQMAIAIKCDAVEERMLRLFFATSLDWFFSRLGPFLPWFRNYPIIEGHPFGEKSVVDVFSHCVWLANRWDGDEGT